MIKQDDILGDLHIHTVASLHAYSTISEIINACKKTNYKYIAITDHLFQLDDPIQRKNETARIEYLSDRMRYEDIFVIGGAEINLNQKVIDIKKFKRAQCWLPIGLHSWFVDFSKINLDDIFNMFKESAENQECTGFAHIERELYKVNPKFSETTEETKKFFDKIIKLAKDNNIPLELNETSFVFREHNPKTHIYYWLNIAKDLKAEIYLGSDSHYHKEIGHFENCLKALNEINYPPELIINLNEKKLDKIVPDFLKRGVYNV